MRENHKKTTQKTDFSPKPSSNHHCCMYFISSEIQFDKYFHQMALFDFFCIFMNINEKVKNEDKTIELKNGRVPTKILISQQQLVLEHLSWYQINS